MSSFASSATLPRDVAGEARGRTALITGAGSGIGRETALVRGRGRERRGRSIATTRPPRGAEAIRRGRRGARGGDGRRARGRRSRRRSPRPSARSARCTCCSTTPGSSRTRTACGRHPRGGLGPRDRRQPEGRLPRLQVRHPGAAARRRRSIINTASFVAVVGAATAQIAYTASKGGVLAMTREIAVAYASRASAPTRCARAGRTPLLQPLLADPARAPAGSCTCRWAGSQGGRDRARGAVPGVGRVVVRERGDIPGRRRHTAAYVTAE